MPLEQSMPPYLGARAFGVELSSDTPAPSEGLGFVVEFDYAGAETDRGELEGPCLPLVLSMVAPSGRVVVERVFRDVLPDVAELVPDEGGPHLVRIAERYHNRWFGSLVVDVRGDDHEEVL